MPSPPDGLITATYSDGVDCGLIRRRVGEPYLVLALECFRPLAAPARFGLGGLDEVVIGRGEGRRHLRGRERDRSWLRIEVPDSWLSARHARLVREGREWYLEDCDSKNGTQLDGMPARRALLADGCLIETGGTLFLYRDGVPQAPDEAADCSGDELGDLPPAFATLSPQLRRELRLLARIAAARVPVLIRGETGTGKELTARTIHELSGRAGPLVGVNCGALPRSLIESELFGYKRGAFSGAVDDRLGLVRAADRGTLFLDEIAELGEASQVALLRVLQEKEVLPVGGTRPVKVDLRVVAASHQDLAARVGRGAFRRDLFARLVGFEVVLPPLTQRREDLGLLIGQLVRRAAGARAGAVTFQRSAARALFLHDWPHNVRELEHAVTSALALAGGRAIASHHLPAPARRVLDEIGAARLRDEQALRVELIRLFQKHGGNLSAVAREMGKARMQVRRWILRFGIELAGFRTPATDG